MIVQSLFCYSINSSGISDSPKKTTDDQGYNIGVTNVIRAIEKKLNIFLLSLINLLLSLNYLFKIILRVMTSYMNKMITKH